jgi:hypothetical protein
LHAGNNPERANAAQTPAPLGANLRFDPSDAGGEHLRSIRVPGIVINQPKLGITNVQISFADEIQPATNSAVTLYFRQPKPVPYTVPFGNCVFMDTTFLPGKVTFQLFGHEIELLPRVLVIDRQEHSWRPDTNIALPRGQAALPQEKP